MSVHGCTGGICGLTTDTTDLAASPVDDFIKRWSASAGAERANFQGFAYELCDLLKVDRPIPSVNDADRNPYAFERAVRFRSDDGAGSFGRIDLYKRGCFVLEAKQSLQKGGKKELKFKNQPDLFVPDTKPQGRRSAERAWDVLMMNAKQQAEDYARALPASDGWPPFIIVCDVGHCFEIYADFTGQGKNYAQFPDRTGYRIYLEDLRTDEIRERLRKIWTEPQSLDPSRQSAKVTREIAAQLARVSKALEQRPEKPNAEDVAHFLMRCLFTMFAEDVKLLPEHCFRDWLERARHNPTMFKHELAQLWQAMDKGGYATIAQDTVKRFNGSFFKSPTVFDLGREEIGELWAAAKSDWKEVDPAIFGTLLEQALNPKERAKLGAHYTPRAYVERLVVVTIMEPLRQEWANVQATAERYRFEADTLEAETEKRAAALKTKDQKLLDGIRDARSEVRRIRAKGLEALTTFHKKLCETRVLDPACGTGNFLYVAMEMMKRLEGEVLDSLLDMGGEEALALEKQSVDPHQFLGMELNPRAAAIAELVIWLGYLQWYYRSQSGSPSEPILRDFNNIQVKDAVLTWDGYPVPKVEAHDGKRVETYPNGRKPAWPEAEFIVGNPPFIGGKDIRAELGDAYTEALWAAHNDINDSADFVMYWWDRAASELTRKKPVLQRFGFVTTNSITQTFSRRVVARHLEAKKPVSLLMAIPDHPWRKKPKREAGQPPPADEKMAAVRIAMTVAAAGRHDGVLRDVTREAGLDTDEPEIEFKTSVGRINADLTVGVDVTSGVELLANEGLSSPGVKLHGAGFIVRPREAEALGLGKRKGLDDQIRPYRNGKDLMAIPRGVMVIDLFGLEADDVRRRFPEVYQHVIETVKPERDQNNRTTYRDNWWIFGEPRKDLRPALSGLKRYIATVETAKHRVFQFLDGAILPDNMLVAIGSDDAFHLGVLSSRIHVTWALNSGGTLEDRPRYNKSRCFDPFPFPECSEDMKRRIRAVAEELDAHRKARQAEHPGLTLTEMYNVLEAIRRGDELDDHDERLKNQGLVLLLRELHDTLDCLVFEAYGWPATLPEDEILARLVALNQQRKAAEQAGDVKWLRPAYQIPRFGTETERARLEDERRRTRETGAVARQASLDLDDDLQEMKPRFPTDNELAETTAVMATLASASAPVSIKDVARHFSQGLKIEKRVALTILALARLGHLASPDGGETFLLRRVA